VPLNDSAIVTYTASLASLSRIDASCMGVNTQADYNGGAQSQNFVETHVRVSTSPSAITRFTEEDPVTWPMLLGAISGAFSLVGMAFSFLTETQATSLLAVRACLDPEPLIVDAELPGMMAVDGESPEAREALEEDSKWN